MDEEFSCIKQVKKTVQLPVPLSFATNEITGISEILDNWKRQYVKSLHGIVVDYKNVSLTSRTGFIGINNPFIYYNVTATFDLFCPNIGDIVKGRINRISREHIGCLIQGTINVTIHLSQNSSTELSQFLNLNRDILFEISHFDYERKMIRVTGEITPKCIQLMKDLFPPDTPVNSTHVKYNFGDEIGSERESPNDISFDPLTDSSLNQDNIESDVKSEVLPNNSLIKIKKSKKSKKSKRESESSFFSEISSINESASDKETKTKNKSMPNQFSNKSLVENFSSINLDITESLKKKVVSPKKENKSMPNQSSNKPLVENFSSINLDIPQSLKKKVVLPKKEIQDKGHGKKRKRELSLSEPENEKKKKKRKNKVEEINGLIIKSPDNVDLTDVQKYIKEEVSALVQPISTTKENKSVTTAVLPDKLKVEKKKKKHKDKKSGATKKNSSKKNKPKKKKSKMSASGDVLKKDKKSKKHIGSKSRNKIKKEGEKTHSSKKKKSNPIKSEVS